MITTDKGDVVSTASLAHCDDTALAVSDHQMTLHELASMTNAYTDLAFDASEVLQFGHSRADLPFFAYN